MDKVNEFNKVLDGIVSEIKEKNLLDENLIYLNDSADIDSIINDTPLSESFFEVFTTPKGNIDYVKINDIESRFSVKIGPGEQDSFGWLSAVITIPEGKIVIV